MTKIIMMLRLTSGFRMLNFVLIFMFFLKEADSQQLITPPPYSDTPTEANGRLYNVHYLPDNCLNPWIMAQEEFGGGGIILKNQRRVLMQKYGPYNVQGNIEVDPKSCLVIMPGTEMYFNPGYGIIVNGTLIARGSYLPNQRILMTKNPNISNIIGPSSPWPDDARLVDGNTTQDGRLDLLYKGKWRGVCTNYNNFTEIDLNVTCRHLGYVYGNFTYHSFSNNDTDYMLFEKPACTGSENSLFACPGSVNIQYGERICDGQQVIGFECTGLRPDLARDHWRGLEFYNSTTMEHFDSDKRLLHPKAVSHLEYLDISYAGLDIYYGDGLIHALATISASPYVPLMNNITITGGAFHGLNLTEIRGDIHIANSTISDNRGYGVFIKTAVGRTLINKTDIINNWGDGVKLYMTNYTINQFNKDYPPLTSFCNIPTISRPNFPVILYQDLVDPVGNTQVLNYCTKTYTTAPNQMLTLHVLIMERDPEASGQIIVRDGSDSGPLMMDLVINNGSFPQSVTSKTNKVWIKFEFNKPRLPEGTPPVERCKQHRGCIRFLMELTTSEGPDTELRLYNATVANNNGYGVNVQNMRSKVAVNSSEILENGYGAGLLVHQGAGEVAVNNTRVERNIKSGVNITYSGGYQLFNLSIIAENFGYGVITEYLRVNRSRFENIQKIEVMKSHFLLNEWTAFRIGNYCKGGEYLFNQSFFRFNKHETIEYLSCNISTNTPTNFSMAFNTFEGNKRHAVLIRPVVNTVGIFTNNTFRNHSIGVLRFDNGYDFIENRWYRDFPVNYRMFENKFYDNSGRYVVNLRLTQPSLSQSLAFKFNYLTDNYIHDDFKYLNPRSKANAVIVVSSGNVIVQRNSIYNTESKREIATHLIDPSVIILANYNWWNTQSHAVVYPKLFDQNDRFNLAELKYHPVLKDQWLYGNYDTSDEPEYRWEFVRGLNVGGVLDGNVVLGERSSVYKVDRDIFILKDSFLEILPGTVLEFEPSIGMVVHGRLLVDGAKYFGGPRRITFKLYEEDYLPMENRTIYEKIHLVDGANEYEGRLELNLTGEFGTVCSDGWSDQNSALVCQQLGLTFNPEYGHPTKVTMTTAKDILLSHVQCDELDVDIFDCKAEHVGEFQCDHGRDVFIRCQPATWSGVTIPAIPRYGTTFETQIRHLAIDRAGLLDFAEMSYTPGLRIDYNFYSISHLTVTNCVADGINIKYSNPYSKNLIEHVTVINNLGNGILTRSSFLELSHVTLWRNDMAGLVYDPMFTEYEALSVRNFIARNRAVEITTRSTLRLNSNEMQFLTCSPSNDESPRVFWIEFSTNSFFRITVQVLDYNPLTDIEKVTFYDSDRNNVDVASSWTIEEDLVDFPIVSKRQHLTMKYETFGRRSGRLALAVISNGVNENYHSRIKVFNATISHNERGIVTKHYNNPSNEKMEIFHRTKQEEISFDSIKVENSRKEAMFIPSLTKYHENFIPTIEEMTRPEKVGEITYNIIHSKFINNQRGIHGEHNHVDFANNVWKWNVSYVTITGCESGGFVIELPRVNDLLERQHHGVAFVQSTLRNNQNFEFTVSGYYAVVDISNNQFDNNNCLGGLVSLTGMEKDLEIVNNRLENNYGKFALDMDLYSHSEYSENVVGLLKHNTIINNRYNFQYNGEGTSYMPTTFALGIKGVQNITVNRNILENRELQYELVAGITALTLENKLNVKENYWGTPDQYEMRRRMFDFDDWNNFAIANYFPFISIPDIYGDLSNDQELQVELDINRLGGRITRDLTIPARGIPYIVYSDLTVMPNVTFTIQPGTELQFFPNVGILVLGKLIATGVPTSRIRFGPVTSAFQPQPFASALTSNDVRLKGGKTPNEGFLEFFNTSSRSWNLMCDSQFNEKTAEVVCRMLGMETVNVDVRFTSLYDYIVYGKPMYFLKEFWAYAYYCKGDEENLDLCMKRVNYHIKSCIFAANYTFIRCGPRNLPLPMSYWGNIRIALSNYEEKIVKFVRDSDRSRLEYVDIDGAGMLHGEKVGALQTTYVSPIIHNVNITRSVSNGLDIVAPRYNVDVQTFNISGNLGYGINFLILNGDSKASVESSFITLETNTVPYNLYGLVDICRMEKEIIVENRLILFYKYSQKAVDCVKIIHGRSSIGPKDVAIRFLQFNIYHDDFYRNAVEIFDGKEITETNLLVSLTANSSRSQVQRSYQSTGKTLNIQMHASPSYGYYGFIAEVVTIPLSGLTYPDESYFHRVRNVIMLGNEDGALLYKNVGEITPSIKVDHCWIENNGIAILNLTSPPVIDVGLQSTTIFNFQNSFISRNNGGMYVSATTPSAATKLRANITNNVFSFGTNGEVLNLTGHHYENFYLYENYIFNNTAGDYRDIIHVQNVVVNFTFNTVTRNTGHYVIRLYNTEKTEAIQEYAKNLFSENNATALYRALIHVGSGNPRINHNYLVNEECDFELETNPVDYLPNGQPGYNAPIDARNNWWGSESTGYVNGKIWDKLDNESLVAVDYMPVKINNQSLVYGKCKPGWIRNRDNDKCYKYMGAALPYREADQFCVENGGFLADSKDNEEFLKYLLRLTMNVYDETQRVWVYSRSSGSGCSAFERNRVVGEYDCYYIMHPFVCEEEPYITAPESPVMYAFIIGGVGGLVVVIVLILAILWCVKSKRRKRERFERQSSIRSSIKGSTIKTRSTMSVTAIGRSKQRLDQLSVSSSKYDYDSKSLGASQISLAGVTEDESVTDARENEVRRKLRQRAEIARGRPENDARLEGRNGHAGGRRFRSRDYSENDSDDEGGFSRQKYARRNGGYKHSDESRGYSDKDYDSEEDDDDDDMKKEPLDDTDDEDDRRNGFTPVKFNPRVEKELDSIQMKNDGKIQYLRQNDDTGSVDMGSNGRHLSRSMSSFSQPDNVSKPSSQSSGLNDPVRNAPTPTPPPPLPMNIPAKFGPPSQPRTQPRPVPAPRPKPIPSARSYGSREDITENPDVKLNNLSQDEISEKGSSRERLDHIGNMYDRKKSPSRENLNDFMAPEKSALSRSREKIHGSQGDLTGVGIGIDYLPRADTDKYDYESGRDSPLHQSRENLIPKSKKTDEFQPAYPYPPRTENLSRPETGLVNSSRERLVPYRGRETPQNSDYPDQTGIDYLPRNPGTPRGQQNNMGRLPSANESVAGNPVNFQLPYYDKPHVQYPGSHGNMYPSNEPDAGVDYLPRYEPRHSPAPPYSPAPSYTSTQGIPSPGLNQNQGYQPTVPPGQNMSRSRDNLSRSRENLSHSREYLNRSRENLRNDLRENSLDVVKPRPHKSIETEI